MIPDRLYKQWLNIDISNKCSLKCPECVRTKFIKNKIPLPGKDIDLKQFDKISDFFIGKRFDFCGTFSDAIYNKYFIDMLEMCKQKNIDVCVHTAASHRPESWYIDAFNANKNAEWRFGIDGLPKNSHKYRVNQNGEKLFSTMLIAKEKGLPVSWQYIIFDYNKEEIEEAKNLSKLHKINFLLIDTNRKNGINPVSKTKNKFIPKCVHAKRDLAFSITGHITPCCWTNVSWDEPYLKDIFSKENHIDNFEKIEDVFKTTAWVNFFKMLQENPELAPTTCKEKCSVLINDDVEQTEEWFKFDDN